MLLICLRIASGFNTAYILQNCGVTFHSTRVGFLCKVCVVQEQYFLKAFLIELNIRASVTLQYEAYMSSFTISQWFWDFWGKRVSACRYTVRPDRGYQTLNCTSHHRRQGFTCMHYYHTSSFWLWAEKDPRSAVFLLEFSKFSLYRI